MASKNWDVYTRQGIDFASTIASFGFSAVKSGTKLGFSITREIATSAVGITTFAVDHALFGGSTVTSPILGDAVSNVISIAEQLVLAPIFLGEYITSTSLIAAHSSINVLSVIIPGSSEASFSLASFITLVIREWREPAFGSNLPIQRYGITQIARALVAWVALQGVTQEWQEKRWFDSLREIRVEAPRQFDSVRERRGSRVRVTSDVIFPGNIGQIISADIGVAPVRSQSVFSQHNGSFGRRKLSVKRPRIDFQPRPSNSELKATLRRLSKMVLAGYGGASLLFFGISPTSPFSHSRELPPASAGLDDKTSEESRLTTAIDASEAEAAGQLPPPDEADDSQYSWWDILLGKHDQEIFERFANSPQKTRTEEVKIPATAVIGAERLMPRFWVLTDHDRAQIVLVIRGTMSLNEIAVDLTCESADFEPASTLSNLEHDEEMLVPGQLSFPIRHIPLPSSSVPQPRYHVHSGMLRMARAMGDVGNPVQLAVLEALHRNPDYELVLCGHSLGAGVAALLGLIWADPKTCLTVRSSGLPVGRQVSVYCFAPPCLTDATLGRLASKLIVSFVYSHDVVSRLSLDHVRDIRNAALWLCNANDNDGGNGREGYSAVIKRSARWKAGSGSADDPNWFVAMRKTLEANMQMANTFPPGRVLWAMRDSDLHHSHRRSANKSETNGDKLRLFEVLDVENVFSQVIFARDMLSAHMPHQYDKVLHDLL